MGAAYVSYRHGREFALRYGADEATATLWPLIVDGLLMMATIELWKVSHRHKATGRWTAWLSFSLGIGLSLCANIASAPELNIFSIAVAACPPLALLLAVELLNEALKRRQAEAASALVPEAEGPESGQLEPADLGCSTQAPEATHAVAAEPASRMIVNNKPGPSVAIAPNEVSQDRNGDPLYEEARRLDTEHWSRYQRPISAETLRRQLSVGSKRARSLARYCRQAHQRGLNTATLK